MKLFVDKYGFKVYLDLVEDSRSTLRQRIGYDPFYLNGKQYFVHEVKAEAGGSNTPTGAIIGGTIGLIGGPLGVIVGGALGGLFGNSVDQTEIDKVNFFNRSY
ncbi:MAG: hypothetical protein RJQ00_05255 [Vicingaceae bacterium]